jgi:hypothetical protein
MTTARRNHDHRPAGVGRREFLGALGAAAWGASTAGAFLPQQPTGTAPQRFVLREDRFGRMFPRLPPFAEPSPELEAALLDIGKAGGILDAKDALERGPVDLIVDPALSLNNPNNTLHTAGTTFMGQFIDHDLTFDLTSRLGEPTEPLDSPNARTPSFDLDSVYGGGPSRDPLLYERVSRGSPTKLRIQEGGLFEDVPRNSDGTAIIADPRNDENLMISGLQSAFILFHNKAVDRVRATSRGLSSSDIFRIARRLTTWHYQWIVVNELLPLFVGKPLVDRLLRDGLRFYRPSVAFIPVEFQGAAYRFGHTMVRPSYRANLAGDNGAAFFGMIFDPAGEGSANPVDLRGGARAARRFIGWQTFFDFGDGEMRPNKAIDTKISTPLFRLPLGAIAGGTPPVSLPQRNLLRHVTWELPSGQSIARHMGVPSLSAGDLKELSAYGLGLDTSTPLWYYILKEGEVMEAGQRLGPVGGRIVAEVFLGLLRLDRNSYFSQRRWRPSLPTRSGRVTGEFRMIDFLTFAGVDPTSRGQ